jgi:hypothetical protein
MILFDQIKYLYEFIAFVNPDRLFYRQMLGIMIKIIIIVIVICHVRTNLTI